ncbi:MAG: peptide chain release factor N(5)-glutamine methyltransferase [Cyclobacteriaceae bacterium]
MDSKVSAIYKETVQELTSIYDQREAEIMCNLLFEDLLGISKTDRLIRPDSMLEADRVGKINSAVKRLLLHEPIQHIIGHTHFYGRKFKVNKHTLVPRPETEELVDLIIKENQKPDLQILDIGTGTGCIPISLALEMKRPEVHALDISAGALALAKENAQLNQAYVSFSEMDILTEELKENELDIIVSNPPYIPDLEKSQMDKNVLDYDPEIALFVPDQDPLLFYRVIGEKALKALKAGGKLYFEIHEKYGKATMELLESQGYREVSVFQDLQGKDRIVYAIVGT